MAELYVSEHEEEHNELLLTLGKCFWCGETLDDYVPMDEDEEGA